MDLTPYLLFLLLSFFFSNVSSSPPRSYIIQVEEPIESLTEGGLVSWYKSFLPPDTDDLTADQRLLHSYTDVFRGFAVRLTEEEVQGVAKKEGFVRAFPDRVLHVLTTNTPKFLGLKLGKKSLWNDSRLGSGVIIGVLDTGVTPGHPSYDEEGVPPPPSRWKGSCDLQTGCNNKLIGAKSFIAGEVGRSPIDIGGHGTHTSSTAAGNFVRNVSLYGLAEGTAAGMAPRAHLAIYQVCHQSDGTCSSSDILAGLDAAVKDGVDVLSISLSGPSTPLDQDPIAIGTFAAVKKGIFVSCAAGNSGPDYNSLSNEAPWVLTVAASSVDRSLRASLKLGNGKVIYGESLDQSQNFTKSSLALYHPKEAPSCESRPPGVGYRGKIWVCDSGNSNPREVASFVKSLGATALIFIATDAVGSTILDSRCDFPTILVTSKAGSIIKSYLNTSPEQPATSIVFNGTVLGVSPAPVVAFFSSRGPSLATPGIIKPDIAGPGLNILAAWIPDSPEAVAAGNKNGKYSIISGTSMATAHLSGIAALIKALHPTWSPAAIKSAIVTTADGDVLDEQLEPAIYYAKGAGHVNPAKAVDPGLVYDVDADDYISYICGKFGNSGAKAIVRGSVDCSRIKNVTEAQLNYPSILLEPGDGGVATVRRTVTNVGSARSSYKVSLTSLESVVTVSVTPETLVFTELEEKKSFNVSAKWVNGKPTSGSNFYEGALTWTSHDGHHVVRSPLVVPVIQWAL